MTYVRCTGCSEIIEIPDELKGDMPDGDITDALGEPYYCDACEWEITDTDAYADWRS